MAECLGSCTQNPGATRETVAKVLGIPLENVASYVTLLGGGFGESPSPTMSWRRHCWRRKWQRR